MMTDISILGCGWLGLPLAETFVKAGYNVKGSTTTPEKLTLLKEKNIEPYLIDLSCQTCGNAMEQFLETDILIFNIPPKIGQTGEEGYLMQIRRLLNFVRDSPVSRVLFVSSTSVYPVLNRVVEEIDAPEPGSTGAPALLQAERMFADSEEWLTTVVRFGGLVGGNRHPARYLAGKTNVPNPEAPVNLIHLDDCLELILQLVQQEKWEEVYNACADLHPTRKEVYEYAAETLNLPIPLFAPQAGTNFNIISSKKIKEHVSYVFRHPDPMQMVHSLSL